MSVPWNTEFVDKSKVIIKPLAYYKMLVHVLRFGSIAKKKSEYNECMGILIGELQGEAEIKDVIVHDAVPINHGGRVEVKFAETDYISFAAVDADFFEKGWFSVGWYHSHPELSVFFSAVDIRNQLGWQTQNPSAIGIVWDHIRFETIEGDMGFETFRLDDPSKEMSSNYHTVETVVEPPDSIEFYQKIKELIDSIHSKEPVILEINETPDVFGDISMPGQSQMMAKQPELELMDILQSLNEGVAKFTAAFFEPLIRFLNRWAQDTSNQVIKSNIKMRDTLVNLRNNLANSLNQLQNWFKFALIESFGEVDGYIDDKFDLLDENKEKLKRMLDELKDTIESQLDKLFEEKIDNMLKDISFALEGGAAKFKNVQSSSQKNFDFIDQNNKIVKDTAKKIKELSSSIEKGIDINVKNIGSQINKNLSQLAKEISETSKKQEDLISNLDASLSILENIRNDLKKTEENAETSQGGP